ncbi:MAG TPA: polyphosphate kinase 1, partial [Bacteroidales bacterium]|nr:polyphosphate kinase 1 [Bacteroidales bacterium]
LEVQARFDEEANIYWAGKLQEEGVKIIQTIPGYKVHAKLMLIRRKESEDNVYYAYVGTGNFHEGTARVYADDGLLTADETITADVNKVFHLLEEKFNRPSFGKLIVAPFHLRNVMIRLLNFEIMQARKGHEAWAVIKLNSLVDEVLVKKLYRASQAGVKIRLIIRGICVLIPGIPGVSENIEAISIVDKYLEHSRVMVFHHGGIEKYYISSADWMTRNLDHRIEVACPVEDPDIREELRTMLDIQWSDNTKARLHGTEQPNAYRIPEVPQDEVRSQVAIYEYFRNQL